MQLTNENPAAPMPRQHPLAALGPRLALLLLLLGGAFTLHAEEALLEEVLVTAEFRPVDQQDLAASVTVFGQRAMEERGAVHLDQLLNLAPNVNFSSGASRGRFIQIRGTGERSQFVEPVNPSVGLIIDGMDFTGIGGVASTLDMRQVEVLRGPQGTLFGANALAGLINMVSNGPEDEFSATAQLMVGNENHWTSSAALGGPLGQTLGYRVAIQSNQGDGYMNNRFLGRPTNTLDEVNARGRLGWSPTDQFDLDLTWLLTRVDNGYDAFSLDNTRDTYSDEPGQDRLDSSGFSARGSWAPGGFGTQDLSLEALVSHVDADTVYRYDEDWSNPGICAGTACDFDLWGFDWWYQSTDAYTRSNQNTSADVRLLADGGAEGLSWVTGVYWRDQQQALERDYTFGNGLFSSRYDTVNVALYGQMDLPLTPRWTAGLGLRWETRDWDYMDGQNSGGEARDSESFWGGRANLEFRDEKDRLWYGLVSRGYKAGGYNTALASQLPELAEQGIFLSPDQLVFDGESLWNLELGVKGAALEERLTFALTLFYQDRSDLQLKQSIVIPADPVSNACPCVFIDGLQNAAGGTNSGLELELDWLLNERVLLFGSLGLLRTRYEDFLSFTHADADLENAIPYDLSGRSQAHAPDYQYTLGADLVLTDSLSLRADIEGKDGFYASANHNEKTVSYTLLNLRLNLDLGHWSLALWGRNLTDETVQTRGFGGFGNDPRKLYAVEPYYQLGEPRVYGLTAILRY